MRSRERVLQSLESVYRAAFEDAEKRDDRAAMERLDLEYQRDQLQLEVLIDIRDLLTSPTKEPEKKEPSLIERAQTIRRITRLR